MKILNYIRFVFLLPAYLFVNVIFIINIIKAWRNGYFLNQINIGEYVKKVVDEIFIRVSKYFIHISCIFWILLALLLSI
jgi:hypothetical protein